MHRSLPVATALGMLLTLGSGLAAMAHEGGGGEKILVEPSTVAAGGTVVLAGSGLEPNDERVIVLVGEHDTLHLAEATTDADGMLSVELTVPTHVTSGTYELRAIGDETLTVPLAVTAAAGAQDAPTITDEPISARQRGTAELGIIVVLAVVIAALGARLAWTAERFRGTPTA